MVEALILPDGENIVSDLGDDEVGTECKFKFCKMGENEGA
jgi:hypothetical protein